MSRVFTALRGLTVCLGREGLSIEDESALLGALFLLAERLARPKNSMATENSTISDTATCIGQSRPPAVAAIGKSPSEPLPPVESACTTPSALPAEIMPIIFRYLVPADLHTCLLVCRRWHRAAIPALYKTPRLQSLRAVRAFIKLISTDEAPRLWPYTEIVRRIQFTAEEDASLTADRPSDCDFFSKSCSSLFRILVIDRQREPDAAAHPLFFTLARTCPSLEAIEESAFAAVEQPPAAVEEAYSPARATSTPPDQFMLTQTVLANLLVSCKHAARTADLLGIPASRLAQVCTKLLELFNGDAHAVWPAGAGEAEDDGEKAASLHRARSIVLGRCRIALNQLSSAMYLEAQYLALSAQRLLDRYALAYCRGFAAGRRLDVQFAAREAREDAICGHPGTLTQALRLVFRQPLDSDSHPSFPQNELPAELALWFQAEINGDVPEGDGGADIAPTTYVFPTAEFLEGALSVFPPADMNAETAELVAELLERHERNCASSSSPSRHYIRQENVEEHARWIAWLQDIIAWSRGAAEMEAVKDLLRGSMKRMEIFRGLQVMCQLPGQTRAVSGLLN
ncbi:hypothetical protein HDU88_002043 [Geranomyces variabilis]|nr:hypothetical protein HDU88_002043 [Geranomyces variabilis]